jgi:ubiquinone/menaquinone biosynthesis C-methylase UbiE
MDVDSRRSVCDGAYMADEYSVSTYGDRIAEVYDDWPGVPRDSGPAAAFLAKLAGRGPALELGIGTGRLALPLKALGVEVEGIDGSEGMIAKLRVKPGGAEIPNRIAEVYDDWPGVPRDSGPCNDRELC